MKPITQVVVHMYTMGTGDCFVLKFKSGDEVTFRMLIDCGCYTRKFIEIRRYLREIRRDVGGHLDALVVTHEHNDHVLGFQAGKALFTGAGFTVDRVWMGWPEDDEDDTVKEWKREHGQKKRALALAAARVKRAVRSAAFRSSLAGTGRGDEVLASRKRFAAVLADFAALHASEYVGSLRGMAVVKEQLAADSEVGYHGAGSVIDNIPGLDGIRIFVLGPPRMHGAVDTEPGDPGDAYAHNRDVDDSDLFVRAVSPVADAALDADLSPFDSSFVLDRADRPRAYTRRGAAWRRIDHDWLFSSGHLALRLDSMTNNLSLCLAIEHVDSGKVLLFPGDAEFGSWNSWHDIDWRDEQGIDVTTEQLLNRVVFYKVAHHLSHNGTARERGLQMMTSPELCAMVPLDYEVISSSWQSTMPSRMILKELLERTRGRTIVMNEAELTYDLEGRVPLADKIEQARQRMSAAERAAFDEATDATDHYLEYVLTI